MLILVVAKPYRSNADTDDDYDNVADDADDADDGG